MVKTYTVDKPLFKLGNTLGEGTSLTPYDPLQRPVIANKVCRVCLGSYGRHQASPSMHVLTFDRIHARNDSTSSTSTRRSFTHTSPHLGQLGTMYSTIRSQR